MQDKEKVRTPSLSLSSKKLAAIVVERQELLDIRLILFSGMHDFDLESPPPSLDVQVVTHAKSRTDQSGGQDILYILFIFSVTAKASDGIDGRAELKAGYELSYRLSSLDGLTNDHFEAFAEWVCIYNAWPYLRQFVQSMSTQMGLPSFTLPIFKPKTDRQNVAKDSTAEA